MMVLLPVFGAPMKAASTDLRGARACAHSGSCSRIPDDQPGAAVDRDHPAYSGSTADIAAVPVGARCSPRGGGGEALAPAAGAEAGAGRVCQSPGPGVTPSPTTLAAPRSPIGWPRWWMTRREPYGPSLAQAPTLTANCVSDMVMFFPPICIEMVPR